MAFTIEQVKWRFGNEGPRSLTKLIRDLESEGHTCVALTAPTAGPAIRAHSPFKSGWKKGSTAANSVKSPPAAGNGSGCWLTARRRRERRSCWLY
ncbi:MAG TPA: hypothetical protein VGX76_19905 [Pirellulales bacterium]|nr:hypothetical protein [Pirellulales bacterium]